MKLFIILFAAAAAGVAVHSQQVAPPRDPNAPPQMRPMPVGTSSVSGTVTAAAGGKPVSGAIVRINGAAIVPESALRSLTSEPSGLGRGSGLASVSLSINRSVVTDASGRFSFPKLPAGHFTLSVSKASFLAANFGQKRPSAQGTTILVAEGQAFTANMTLVRGGVIAGTVFGADGEPAPRVQVGAWRYQVLGSTRRFQQNASVQTDDRGMYRLTNLQPGDYFISATANMNDGSLFARQTADSAAVEQAIASAPVRPPSAPGLPATVLVPTPQQGMSMALEAFPGFLPTFYPGTSARLNAQAIRVTGGDEHAGTDIAVQPVEAGIIVVTVTSPLRPGVTVQASLISDDPSDSNNSSWGTDQTGKITFRSVPPGTYTVMIQTQVQPGRGPAAPPPLAEEDRMWGSATVTVAGSTPNSVSIGLGPGRSISGVVVFDMARAPDLSRTRLSVVAVPAPGSPSFSMNPNAVVEPDGRFTIKGVFPGRYSLRVQGAGTMKSSMVSNVETLDTPVDFPATEDISDAVLTITDKFSELSGLLTDAGGKPGIDYTVIVATTDERFWMFGSRRIVTTRTGADGKYLLRSLPPGDYNVTVVTDFEQGTQYDPEFLRSLIGAGTRVRVTEGGKTVQDLRVR